MVEFYNHLLRFAGWVDVLTYSVGDFPPSLPLRHVIVAAETHPDIGWLKSKAKVRVSRGIHSKLWIARCNSSIEIYIGSLNLTAPTNGNIMVAIKHDKRKWVRYFNHIWKHSK